MVCKTCLCAGPSPKPERIPKQAAELVHERRQDTEIRILKLEKERLLESLVLAEKRAKVFNGLTKFSASPIKAREPRSGLREATAVVLCSDWHVEEPVEPEKVNGLNEYNLEIADGRIDRMIDNVLWLLQMHQHEIKIRDMILWLGGDLFSGYIHEDLAETAQLSPVECVLWLQARVTKMIDTLLASSSLEKIIIPCSFGNHGRTTRKIRIQTGAENSYEWMMYQQLALQYKHEKRVVFVAPKSQLIYLRAYDFVLRFAHGDQISFQGGVGGLTIPLNKRIHAWNVAQRADITCIGHWHTYFSAPHFVVNGSLIGYNPFSIRIGAEYEPPQQSFFLVDSRHGKCLSTPIWLEPPQGEAELIAA